MPYLVYNDACHLHRIIQNNPHWSNTATPIDVFHHQRKPTYLHCQTHCNPANFPDLVDSSKPGENGWIFNTSIAEQTNGWIGGYQSMVRLMEPVWYNFFLDEMIKQCNRYIISELNKHGSNPITLSRLDLLG
jgi:hypothetical protein